MTAESQERALEKFMENNSAILGKLETLKGYFENHMGLNPDEVNWGRVGESAHALGLLDSLIAFLDFQESGLS